MEKTEHSDDSPAARPRWVMLNRYSYRRFIDAETMTSAASHTSTGHLFRVSFRLAAPPACSTFHNDWTGSDDEPHRDPEIVAAHGDCLLLDVTCPNPNKMYDNVVIDYFLYDAAADALSLLPACFFPMTFQRGDGAGRVARARHLWKKDTGILRRGSGEVTVAQLEVPDTDDRPKFPRNKAELCVLDTGRLQWELRRDVPIVHGEATAGKAYDLMLWWETDVAVPVGDRFLCFVDYFRGFLVYDVAADLATVELRYVPLPVEVSDLSPNFDGRPCTASFRNLAGAGIDAVRFVTVESRCCCGAAGDSSCERGWFLFTVTAWSLNLAATVWVKESMLDCEELWAMPGYGDLPRRPLSHPIVSSDDPDIVCFILLNGYSRYSDEDREKRKVWMLEINMRSKTLRSVVLYNNEEQQEEYQIAAKLQL
ncbi:unnamed protein product [Urochloa decumbens]|uniref:DUF1618 domain-containing protein n=1 Tax=Urochloa decumbens TaxID=240449 RepID=A0ABC9ANV8_9POAL